MREGLLLVASVAVTLAVALGLVRWLAPGLLGLPADLRVVQVEEKVAPFFATVFAETGAARGLVNDPHTIVRGVPLAPDIGPRGPHDVLGFRNRSVPNRAEVIAIGDSHTYGASVRYDQTWLRALARRLDGPRVYGMAMGGWGAVQYLDLFGKALAFEPRALIVAFYAGNDAHESFRAAFGVEHWAFLRPDPALRGADLGKGAPDRPWTVSLGASGPMTFTPGLRLRSNADTPALRAGWRIMADVGRRIAEDARARDLPVVFTVLPTKERVYEPVVRQSSARIDPVFEMLVRAEAASVSALLRELRALPGARTVDVLPALQQAALAGRPVYPADRNGHPAAAGHAVIAEALRPAVTEALGRDGHAGP